ncbi:MAG: helix-turn-helix domain-containing protein [Gemmataceae bacterium]|nr:helix-turn-helix domain-containing protein [Gemmataceae bacterium]
MITTQHLGTIDELGVQVALALAVDYDGAPNGRVRGVPDQRTIRYYTTLGLLDRPAEMRGRTALYGRRHLLQLVAIKRLQANGLSLAEIQQRLLGATDKVLTELARLPEDAQARRDEGGTGAGRPSAAFWTTVPAPVEASSAVRESPEERAIAPSTLQGIPLADAVTLLLTAVRPLDDDDLQAIRTVAAPLLKLLDKRRLVARAQKGTGDDQDAVDPQ